MVENLMYEIGTIMENHFEAEKANALGHHVFEISLLLYNYKNSIGQ